jgi:PmbA protein
MEELVQSYFNLERLQTLVSDVLKETTQQGSSSAEVDIASNKGFTVTVRKGEPESIEYHQDKILNITVYLGQRVGSASLSDLRPEAIRSAVQAACHIAQYTDEDPYSGLPDKNQLAFGYPQLDLAYPWKLSVEEAVELARECEALALAEDKKITNSDGVSITTSDAVTIQGNTHGFVGGYRLTRHEISCLLIASHGDEMQRDYSYSMACDPQLLTSIKEIAKEAAHRTVRRLGARKLTTRHVPVIFAAEEARGFLGHFVAAISGGNLYRKMSFLLDQLGQPIFPSFITLDERPHLAKGLGSLPFDDDGLPTQAKAFVKDGILQNYCLGIYSARKLGMQPTGNAGGVHNLFISTGKKDLNALLKTMDTGFLVTELMGQGVNLVTGDYSRGASGFWVENGVIQYSVEEVTIAGNLKELYSHIIEVGSDIDPRGNIRTGSILIENMIVAGN